MDDMLARRSAHVAGHSTGPRFPAIGRRTAALSEEAVVARDWNFLPSRIIGRASNTADSADCSNSASSNTCEKPMGTSVGTDITIAILVPLAVIFICALIYLHRRNTKRQAMEDRDPHHKSLDFGLPDGVAGSSKSKRKSKMGLVSEKGSSKTRGLSIDMNLSSPYLLPDHVQGSRESMSSLARTLHQADDPYRPVAALMSETSSIKGGRYSPSVMTNSTKHNSRQSYGASPGAPTPYPRSPLAPSSSSTITVVDSDFAGPSPIDKIPEHGPMPPPQCELPAIPTSAQVQQPAPVAQRDGSVEPMQKFDLPPFSSSTADQLDPQAPTQSSPVSEVTITKDFSAGPGHQSVSAVIEHSEDYSEFDYAALVTSAADDDEERGRGRARESGLVVPTQDGNQLSVGPRPLPPSDMLEHEDPETRANRIRSFYKEYFEESKGGPVAGDYGADFYGGSDAAYFDPDSNQFVMPYAQPITRRAMTPPPTGRIPGGPGGPRGPGPRGRGGPGGPGPRGLPRNYAGSMGGSSMHGMPMPPRAGSSMSGYGPRPGSSASARGPRSGSAMAGKVKKAGPPPSPLNTLPTPGKLTDDHFSLINAADFAPPTTYGDRVAGRSQSPMGGRRPYAVNVPAASPLVGSFEEMAALPSPYALQKSGTFNGLDFAPPKRIRDAENASDAGSIRSNKSGLSRVNDIAIRNGAGRVSRLPGDIIFSQAQLEVQLKPRFDMISR